MTRQQQQEVRSYAEKLGLKVVRFEKRSKHDSAILSNGKRSRFITLSATPSDFRTGYAVQRDIRKVARELREQDKPLAAPVIEQNKPKPNFPWLAQPTEQQVEQPAPLEIVYHYTTSAALPFIIAKGNIHNRQEAILQATENREKTDTGTYRAWNNGNDPYRQGLVQRVRFACHAEDFEKIGPDTYTRREPLPLDRVIACDVRSYLGHRWKPFDLNSKIYRLEDQPHFEGARFIGVVIGNKFYPSAEVEIEDGGMVYGNGYKMHLGSRLV
jgi:hypothetical protein